MEASSQKLPRDWLRLRRCLSLFQDTLSLFRFSDQAVPVPVPVSVPVQKRSQSRFPKHHFRQGGACPGLRPSRKSRMSPFPRDWLRLRRCLSLFPSRFPSKSGACPGSRRFPSAAVPVPVPSAPLNGDRHRRRWRSQSPLTPLSRYPSPYASRFPLARIPSVGLS